MQEISRVLTTRYGNVMLDITSDIRSTIARRTGHHIDKHQSIVGYAWRIQTGPNMGIILSYSDDHNYSMLATAAHEAVHLAQFIRDEGKAISAETEALFVEQIVGLIQQGAN